MTSAKGRTDEAYTAAGPCCCTVGLESDTSPFLNDICIKLTCHQTLLPEIIDSFVAIDAALKVGCLPVGLDSNTIQIPHIDLDAGETGSVRRQGMTTADSIEGDIVVVGVPHL